jgi:drug/metabolite transporter (DMT)-like permease
MALFFAGKFDLTNTTGNIIGILSGISFAFFSLFIKWKKKLHLSVNTVFNIMAGNFILSAICLPFAIGNLILNPIQLLMLLYLGIFQIGISYMIFNEGIKYVSATESLIFAMLETVFNPFWVFLGIGEVPSQYALAGGVIIITAILMHNFILQEKTN